MAEFKDKVQISIEIDGRQSINELGKLEIQQAKLKKEQRDLTKDTKAYNRAVEKLAKIQNKNSVAYQKTKLKVDQLKSSYDKYVTVSGKLNQITDEVTAQRNELGLLGQTMRQLNSTRRDLNRQLGNLTQGTSEYKKVGERLFAVNQHLAKQKQELRGTRKGWAKFKEELKGFKAIAIGNIVADLGLRAFNGIGDAIVGIAKGAAKMSDSLSDIVKKTGQSLEEVKELNSELSKLDTRTSTSDLRGIAVIGGSLGVAKDEMLGFVAATDMAVVALGDEFTDGAEQVARELGTLKNLFEETKSLEYGEGIEKVGSIINTLGNNGSATADKMANFAKRLGASGNLAPNIKQTLGLGAALIELGVRADQAASGTSKILNTAAAETKAFALQIGITEDKFKDLINSNPNEVLLQLAESMKGFSNTQIVEALNKMKIGSLESVKVMNLLANKTDFVREKQALANEAFKENISLQKEFNIKNTNTAAKMEKAAKEWSKFKVIITNQLLPAIMFSIDAFVALLHALRALPKWINENKVTLILLTTALLTYNSALIASTVLTIRNSLAKQAGIIWSKRAAISTGLNAAATKAYSASQAISLLWTSKVTKAVKIQTAVTKLAAIASRAFSTALAATGWGTVIALIGLAIAAWFAYKNSVEDARKAQRKLKEEQTKLNNQIAEELSKVETLFALLKNQNTTLDEKRKIIKKLNTEYGKYIGKLITEKTSYEELEIARKNATQALIEEIIVKSEQDKLQKFIQVQISKNNELLSIENTHKQKQIKAEVEYQKLIRKRDNKNNKFTKEELTNLNQEIVYAKYTKNKLIKDFERLKYNLDRTRRIAKADLRDFQNENKKLASQQLEGFGISERKGSSTTNPIVDTKDNQKVNATNAGSTDTSAAEKKQAEYDSLIEQWKAYQTKLRELEGENRLEKLSKKEQEIEESRIHFEKLINEAREFGTKSKDLEVIANQEIKILKDAQELAKKEITEKYRQEELAKLADFREKLTEKQRTEQEKELATENQQYFSMLDQLKVFLDTKLLTEIEYNQLKEDLETLHKGNLLLINEKYVAKTKALRDKEKATEDKAVQDKINQEQQKYRAVGKMLGDFSGLVSATNALIGKQGEEMSGFQQALVLFQIAVDTASSLSASIAGATSAAATTGPLAPFVLTGYIASMFASVFGGMAQAKKLLNSENKPKAPKVDKIQGYAVGGFTGLPSVASGGFVSSQTATFGERGQEYVIPNHLLGTPQVANFVDIIEAMRTGKNPSVSSAAPPAQASGQSDTALLEANIAILNEMKNLRSDMKQQKSDLRAVISFSDIEEKQKEAQDIYDDTDF